MEYCLYKPVCSGYNVCQFIGSCRAGFEMPHSFNRVTYLGRGEHETYADRKLSGRIGIYHTDAERMFHYYVRPQATGNRTDVRWMQVSDELEKDCLCGGRSHLNLVYLLSLMRI